MKTHYLYKIPGCLYKGFRFLFQSAEAKFRIRQSEVSTAGLFSDIDLFKTEVGPTAKPSEHDRWVESTAALTKAVAACTKAAQKPAPKKQQTNPKPSTSGGKKQAKGANNSGGTKKRNSRSKTKGKKVAKVAPTTSTAAAAADVTKKATEAKTTE